MNNSIKSALCAATLFCTPSIASAQEDHNPHHNHHTGHENHRSTAPLGVMGDHTHNKGEWMTAYSFQHMVMDGNRQGTKSISSETIATTISNPNGPPATFRVVPTEMTMDMHMFSAMYGVTDKLTLMGMAMYMNNSMDHITFAGGAGTTQLGTFTTRSKGWGDISLTGIYNAYQNDKTNINIGLGISAPTGSITETDDVLAPTGATPTLRLPYAMQLGSGTWDARPSITYTGTHDKWSWGAQYEGTIRLESKNSEGYRLGNHHNLAAWGGYQLCDEWSINANISAEKLGRIKGADANITAPVQTADPNNYGGEMIEIGAGFTYSPDIAPIKGLELGVDLSTPAYQDLNGVQLERDWSIAAGISYRF